MTDSKILLSGQIVHSEVIESIEEISGQSLFSCYQCGKCSAGCPNTEAMDILPHSVIRLLQLGQVETVRKRKALWVCAACQTCKDRCPRGVDLSKIMEALREINLRENISYVNPSALPVEELEELPPIALIANFRKFTP